MLFILAIAYLTFPVFVLLFTFFSTPFVVLSGIALVTLTFYLLPIAKWKFKHKSLLRYWPLILITLLITYVCLTPFESVDWSGYVTTFNLLEDSTWPPVSQYRDTMFFSALLLGLVYTACTDLQTIW